MGLFQFTPFSPASQSPLHAASPSPTLLLIGAGVLLLLGLFFLLRAMIRFHTRATKGFKRIVLQIAVPKERKSEGQSGKPEGDDRLEHVREEIAITETFFSAIAGLKGERGIKKWFMGRNDHIAFELVVHNGLIYFYIATPVRYRQLIEQQIHAQYPYAQIDEMLDYNIFSKESAIVGAYLTASRKSVFPFKTYKTLDSDPLSAILNVLARIREQNSSAAVQLVIRSAHKRWRRRGVMIVREVKKGKKFEHVAHQWAITRIFREIWESMNQQKKKNMESRNHYVISAMEEDMLKGIEQKLSKGGMEVVIRLLSVSDTAEAARMNLENLVHAFHQYSLYRYGNTFTAMIPRKQSLLIQDFIYRTFHERRDMVLNTEEMASLWHLPLHSTEAPNIKWMTGRRAAPPVNMPRDGLLLGHIPYRGTDTPVYIKNSDRRRHLYIIGKSGSGKSVLIANLAIQDIQQGEGVCVVDPHGDLIESILHHIPKERADDVVLFEPADMERPMGLNMLEAKTVDQKDFAVQEMISIFYKLFPPEMIGPLFEHNMRNVMLTLMADINEPGTIIDIPRMFTDDDYVKVYLKKLKDPVVRSFWEKEMAKTSDFHKSEMLGYLISKVGRFVENEMMRNIMGQQKSGFDFREIMDSQKILLVNLAKGKVGEVNAKLLGLIVVAKLQMAALARADLPEEDRKDFYLYIDEFQNFITDSISTILSEARKYRLDLIIAHQYMGQLLSEKDKKTDVRDAVLGNVGTMCIGRIGPEDAEVLAKEFQPTFGFYDLLNPPSFSYYTKLLVDNEVTKPFNMQGYPPRRGNPALGEAIRQLSRLKYGRDRRIVEHEILERSQLGVGQTQGKTDMIESTL